jgi:AraC-like DNA-binding protein/ligand-binding sensor protein
MQTVAQENRVLVDQLKRSRVFRDYERAFRDTTGLALRLRPAETFDPTQRISSNENPFCTLLAGANHSCAACLEAREKRAESARRGSKTAPCFAGLSDSAVPVRVGGNLIAFLETGQILLQAPEETQFNELARQLTASGSSPDLKRARTAYFQSRVIPEERYASILRLLEIFAEYLATMSNQLMVQESALESPAIARARNYIAARHAEPLSLADVARSVNMSAFYFCKTFKRATGMTFTDYLSRIRVEKVKGLLLNPHKRISEAAYETGFQSLSQFNRVFRRIAGEAPTAYRERLHGVARN